MEGKTERVQKVKIGDILQDLTKDEVASFISSYCRRDKSFEIAFKSHFISRIRSEDQEIKYKKILGEIIKPKTVNNPKITISQKKIINIIFDDFVQQMNDALSQGDFKEAYFLTKESLDKISYLQNRFLIKDNNLEKCRVKFLEGIDMILGQDLAPQFRKYAESMLVEISRKSYYIPSSQNLISVLNKHGVFTEKEKAELIGELQSKAHSSGEKKDILSTLIELTHPFDSLAKELLLSFDHKDIFDALKTLQSLGKYQYAEFYLETEGLGFNYQKPLLAAYAFLYQEKYSKLSKAIRKISPQELDADNLGQFISSIPNDYLKKDIVHLQKWINKLSLTHKCYLLSKAEQHDQLFELLENKGEVEWLKAYDSVLIKSGMKKQVADLYLKLVKEFLNNHIGTKSTDFLNKLYFHFNKIGEPMLLQKISNFVSNNFSHRKTIKTFIR